MNTYHWLNWAALLVLGLGMGAMLYLIWDNIWGNWSLAAWRYKWWDVLLPMIGLIFLASLAIINLGYIFGWWIL